ncbi:hypothetical protein BLGI_3366 [Brevibacillus laterosporus GI-9]|nr:hypothetical protein BLGI_3366 [Brevibacillus laterosporus GI-9]
MPSKAQEHPIYERHLELLHLSLTPTCMQRKTKIFMDTELFQSVRPQKIF